MDNPRDSIDQESKQEIIRENEDKWEEQNNPLLIEVEKPDKMIWHSMNHLVNMRLFGGCIRCPWGK